jgi:hypothetical protein
MPETAVAGARNGRLVPYEKDHTKKTVCAIKLTVKDLSGGR